MTDFFKSAFGMFGNQAGGGGGNSAASSSANAAPAGQQASSGNARNDFVGQIIQLGSYKLKVTKQLAEGNSAQINSNNQSSYYFCRLKGGFAIVYVVQDLTNGTDYALKVLN